MRKGLYSFQTEMFSLYNALISLIIINYLYIYHFFGLSSSCNAAIVLLRGTEASAAELHLLSSEESSSARFVLSHCDKEFVLIHFVSKSTDSNPRHALSGVRK